MTNKYKDSLFGAFVQYLHNNPQQEKFILPIAFCFDLPFLTLYCITLYKDPNAVIFFPFFYIVIYGGGVLFFYIMLYRELKIKDGKIKPFF